MFLNFKILYFSLRKGSLILGTISTKIENIHLNNVKIMSVPALFPNFGTYFRTKTFKFWSSKFLMYKAQHVTRR